MRISGTIQDWGSAPNDYGFILAAGVKPECFHTRTRFLSFVPMDRKEMRGQQVEFAVKTDPRGGKLRIAYDVVLVEKNFNVAEV